MLLLTGKWKIGWGSTKVRSGYCQTGSNSQRKGSWFVQITDVVWSKWYAWQEVTVQQTFFYFDKIKIELYLIINQWPSIFYSWKTGCGGGAHAYVFYKQFCFTNYSLQHSIATQCKVNKVYNLASAFVQYNEYFTEARSQNCNSPVRSMWKCHHILLALHVPTWRR